MSYFILFIFKCPDCNKSRQKSYLSKSIVLKYYFGKVKVSGIKCIYVPNVQVNVSNIYYTVYRVYWLLIYPDDYRITWLTFF